MNFSELVAFIPLLAAFAYLIFLLAAFVRREKQTGWLALFFTCSILWEVTLFLTPAKPIIYNFNLPAKTLLLCTVVLGITTAVYQQNKHTKRWVWGGTAALLFIIAVDSYFLLLAPSADASAAANQFDTVMTLTQLTVWALLSGFMLFSTWHNYRYANSPWRANRLFLWGICLLAIFTGEALLQSEIVWLQLSGQLLRLLGAWGCLYALTVRNLMDMRIRMRRLLAFVLTIIIAAIPVIIAIVLVILFLSYFSTGMTIIFTAVIIPISLMIFIPFRQWISNLINRYLFGRRIDTNQVVGYYNELIASTLEIDQLARVIIGTLSDLWQIERGALLLARQDNELIRLEPIPGRGQVPRIVHFLHEEGSIAKFFHEKRRPLLRYELEMDLQEELAPETVEWLELLDMEAYAPINNGQHLAGVIAIGSKPSGQIFQQDDLTLLQLLARQTAVVLQNARLYSALESRSQNIRDLNRNLLNQNERLETMDKVKTDFITVASHELRTPLTQVKGYNDLLAALNGDGSLNPEQTREISGYIDRAAAQMERVISAMLDASQLETESIILNLKAVSLGPLIQAATANFQGALRERQIRVQMLGLEEIPQLYVDAQRIEQVFNNVLGNAIKYTPDRGQISVSAQVVPTIDKTAPQVELVVRDSGIGIDPQYHELVFEKFFQIGEPSLHSTSSTKFKGGGTGLGLHIARGVVEAHNGRIWVESPGTDEERLPGCEIHILLPVFEENLEPASVA